MNKPDEHTLNRWLLGELEGEELRKVEAWANDHAGDLDSEFKCGIGWEALGAQFMNAISSSEEPPYPEFFNHKLQQAIEAEDSNLSPVPVDTIPEVSLWQKLRWMVMPTAVAAGVAFYAGSQMTQPSSDTPLAGVGEVATIVSYERIYVPDNDVFAAFSETDRATEIVLKGLHPISDELDIVKGDTSVGTPPTMMVTHPNEDGSDFSENPVTFF